MSLSQRLLLYQVVVVAGMTVTVGIIAGLVGPLEFEHQMEQLSHADPTVLPHAVEAFQSAGLTTVAVGLGIAAAGALAVDVLVTHRMASALHALAAGAARVADGDYTTVVALPTRDRELETVASSLNSMATRIAHTEVTRRRMLTDLSHEMRTPLATLQVLLEALEDGVVQADRTTLDRFRVQTARLIRLARDIREVSATEEDHLGLRRVPTALNDLVTEVARTSKPACDQRGVRLVCREAPTRLVVEVDPIRIGLILDHLLRNAAQHTPQGGTITVWFDADAHHVRIGVRDDGVGIAPEDLVQVFEHFYGGGLLRHDRGAGAGVGLAISRAIAVAHGGQLTAASGGLGHGAEFVLTLPRPETGHSAPQDSAKSRQRSIAGTRSDL